MGIAYFEEPSLIAEVRRAGFVRGYRQVWGADDIEPYDYRTADTYAFLFRTPVGARAGLTAFKRVVSGSSRLRWPAFGSASFGRAELGIKPWATYLWRIGNLVLEVSAYCDVECQFDDVVQVTHAYARVLDRNARSMK